MVTRHVEVVDVAEHHAELPVKMPTDVLHWLRTHDLHDLKYLMLEMHSDGEDITEYAPILEELEHLERQWKLLGYLPASEDDLNPLEYVEEEIIEAIHA